MGEPQVVDHLPEEPVQIRKVATIPDPVRRMSLLQDPAPVFGNPGDPQPRREQWERDVR
jgi:hypothetical protein